MAEFEDLGVLKGGQKSVPFFHWPVKWPFFKILKTDKYSGIVSLTLNIPGVERFVHQFLFLRFSQKFFPATYDKTLCKFLLYTYEDSHNSFWSKILSREHVEYVYVAWVKNINFKDCNFRVLRGIFGGYP